MRHAPVAIALLVALASCGKNPPEQNNAAAETPLPAPTPSNTAMPAPPAPGALPPADANLRFIGTWAAEQGMCRGGAWRFSERGLETAGEVSCRFQRINPVPGGYDIASLCTAEGEETRDTLRLRFAESARAMMVETDKVLQPVGLIYCGSGAGQAG